MPEYCYQSLEADEIRLLELYAGGFNTELEASLHSFRLPEDDEPGEGQGQVLLTRDDGSDVPNAPEFEALSYTWGSTSLSQHVLKLIDDSHATHMEIRPNLDGALRRLRRDIPPEKSRFLWIDAVCINQSDLSEKSRQIPKMAMIYNRAKGVCVWLGEEDKEAQSSKAIDFIEALLNLDDFDPLTQDPGTPSEWAALLHLMQRPWFNRRWIVQEISLARRATLYCGSKSVSWQDFSAAVALFASRYQDLRKLFQKSEEYQNHPNYLGEVVALGAKSLVDLTTNIFRKSDDGAVLERLRSLEGLISTMVAFEASSPHDTVYAVLWLAHDAQPDSVGAAAMSEDQLLQTPQNSPPLDPLPSDEELSDNGLDVPALSTRDITYRTPYPKKKDTGLPRLNDVVSKLSRIGTSLKPPSTGPVQSFSGRSASDRSLRNVERHFQGYPQSITVDYSKTVYEVCKDFLEFSIGRSRSLDIICYPWAPEAPNSEPSLPSWISQLSSAPFDKRPNGVYSRVLADPLIGFPGYGMKNYNASGRTKTYPASGFIADKTMIVTGFVIDAIGETRSPAYEGVIPSSWLNLVDWNGSPDPVPDQVWRTLVADRGPDGTKYPPAYFPLACKWMFEQRTRRGGVNTTELLTFGRCPSIAQEFIRRVQSVVWGRKLVLTEGRKNSKQFLGLVPEEAEAGDLICILYGCSVPVVLRRIKSRKESKPHMDAEHIEIIASPPDGGPPVSIVKPSPTPQSAKTESSWATMVPDTPSPREAKTSASLTDLLQTLSVPNEPASLKHASAGVRRALETETSEPKPPNLAVNLESEYKCELIGECYIHGMMDGEAFKHQREHGNKLRLFHLI